MTPHAQSVRSRELCNLAPVIPVLVVGDADRATGLAEALVLGGLPVLEVTLRTPAALEVIRRMAKVPGGYVGAGTVLSPDDVKRAKDAGASFAVSPGATETLVQACIDEALPLLPGAATASEAMRLLEWGYDMLKFFPAEAAGGVKYLKSLGGPLPQISFCPTGGVTLDSAPSYLSQPNILCVGGSWIAPDADVAEANWSAITARAQAAAALGR
ncbi:bifunctional 4-hydroxy-2-oxoglutarate aldolase/2-dehydro-3-deoxy-phosphogluconate aldolase [Paracoccus sp. (in: a-proteobacteria)]|uniref:bifunctional 4-hydroxy-2-oxoglutarate aldolase/2-dehydro-3-deoxy-phosphogluconate aldolase n=1 Tax=Paracoccus sp. TaxID=267 RepID=UPI00289E1036|nr:bifunctional 4-hydroxy-2-oxoglutarate aldolase/2-dehydro-3-deoxy-phosphogluconate aldolase [Paracoccus sp. (in: a-proteobacteria)]